MPLSVQIRVDGLTKREFAFIEVEAKLRGMFLSRFRAELIRRGLQSLRTEARTFPATQASTDPAIRISS